MLPSAGMLGAVAQVRGPISALPDPCAWYSLFHALWWRQDEAERVKLNEKKCAGAPALPLLLGEEGYTIIIRLLTAKVW